MVDFILEEGPWNRNKLEEVVSLNIVAQICELYIPEKEAQDILF